MKVFKSMLAMFLVSSTLASAQPQPAQSSCRKILVVLSSSSFISTKESTRDGTPPHPTGYFLPELTGPVSALLKAGYEVVIAVPKPTNPDGTPKPAEMDKISDDPKWFKSEDAYKAAKQLIQDLPGLKTPQGLSSFTEEGALKDFAGIFIPGGHAPMEDLAEDQHLGIILKFFHDQGKPTALICHGPAALLSTKTWRSEWLYKGYKMTAFSTAEEKQEEDAGVFNGHLLFYLDEQLSNFGGSIDVGQPWTSHAVRDRELITGQNPMSEEAFTGLLLEALADYRLQKKSIINADLPRGDKIEDGILYNVLGQPVDWNKGYRTFFVGARKGDLPQDQFLPRMENHVRTVIDAFSDKGLQGYVMSVSGNSEVAYQVWTSKEAMEAAFGTKDGQAVVQDAGSFMEMLLFKELGPTPGWLTKKSGR